MADPQEEVPFLTEMEAFRLYVRTGRRVPAHRIVQVKFNPNHDPKDGWFTFKDGAGGSAGMSKRPKASPRAGREDPRSRDTGATMAHDARNPANYARYIVQPGDTLHHILDRSSGEAEEFSQSRSAKYVR